MLVARSDTPLAVVTLNVMLCVGWALLRTHCCRVGSVDVAAIVWFVLNHVASDSKRLARRQSELFFRRIVLSFLCRCIRYVVVSFGRLYHVLCAQSISARGANSEPCIVCIVLDDVRRPIRLGSYHVNIHFRDSNQRPAEVSFLYAFKGELYEGHDAALRLGGRRFSFEVYQVGG